MNDHNPTKATARGSATTQPDPAGEPPDEAAGPPWWEQALGWLGTRPTRRLLLVVLALGLVVSAPFGGWRAATVDEVQVVEPGDIIVTGPLEVTFTEVKWARHPANSLQPQDDSVYLIVYGTVRNTTTEPLQGQPLSDTVRLQDVDDLASTPGWGEPVEHWRDAKPTAHHLLDAQPLLGLGPDLDYEVGWVFSHFSDGSQLPDTMVVEVSGQTRRADSITREMQWLDSAPVATVTLPVVHGNEMDAEDDS